MTAKSWDIFAEWCHFPKNSRDPDKIWYEYLGTKEGTERSVSTYCRQLDKKSPFARDGTYIRKETLVSHECALAEDNYMQYLRELGFEVKGIDTLLSTKIQELKNLGYSKDQVIAIWDKE